MDDTRVHIRRFGIRHQVADDAARRRAMAAQQALLDGELEAALAPLAPAGELVLLRRLALQVTLSDDASDAANARRWAEALGASLQRALQHAGPGGLLRFASRQQAELAFVHDMLQGLSERDWAWRRLALLPAGSEPGAGQRQSALMRLLADEPVRGVPLLRALLPTPHWPALLRRLADGELRGLALSVAWCLSPALAAAWRSDEAPAPLPAADAVAPVAPVDIGPSAAGERRAVADDATAPAWWRPTRDAVGGGPRAAWALRLACLLDVPALARRGAAAVDGQWRSWAEQASTGRPAPTQAATAGAAPPTSPGETARAQDPAAATASPPPTGPADSPRPPGHRAPAATGPEAAAPHDPLADTALHTRCGGLLLLLPLLPASGALALLEDPALGPAAALPQRLHALALRLGAPGPRDAAALAFGALAVHRDPPPAWQPPSAQADVLDRCRECLLDHLAQRLPQWPASQRLARVLWREARITVEPGWVDVRFALAEVSIDLRRAALDLDPGFLPWLGIVLRYVYE